MANKTTRIKYDKQIRKATPGSILIADISGDLTELPIGSNGQYLGVSGGLLSYTTFPSVNVMSELIFKSDSDALRALYTYTDIFTGQDTTLTRVIPAATTEKFGAMSKELVTQIETNTSDIATLKGIGRRFPAHMGTPPAGGFSQATLSTEYTTLSGEPLPPPDGTTIINLDEADGRGVAYTYYEFDAIWHNRGTDVVQQWAEGEEGVVTGVADNPTNTGKLVADADGTGHVAQWSNTLDRVTNLETVRALRTAVDTYVQLPFPDGTYIKLGDYGMVGHDANHNNFSVIYKVIDDGTGNLQWKDQFSISAEAILYIGDFVQEYLYVENEPIYYGGKLWRAKNTFTSGLTFNEADWDELGRSYQVAIDQLNIDLGAEVTRATGVEGNLSDLNTTDKSNLVAAINESLISSDQASEVSYDNTVSGLAANNVQDAIDETVEDLNTETARAEDAENDLNNKKVNIETLINNGDDGFALIDPRSGDIQIKRQNNDLLWYNEAILNGSEVHLRSRLHSDPDYSILAGETDLALLDINGENKWKWYYAKGTPGVGFSADKELAIIADVASEATRAESVETNLQNSKVNNIPQKAAIDWPFITGAGNDFTITVPAGRILTYDTSATPIVTWTGTTPHPISYIGIRQGDQTDDFYGVWSDDRYDENNWTLGRFRVYRDELGTPISIIGTVDSYSNIDGWMDEEYAVRNDLHGSIEVAGDIETIEWKGAIAVNSAPIVNELETTRNELLGYISDLDETKASRGVVIRQRYQTVRVNGVNETSDPAPVIDGGQLTIYLEDGTAPDNMRRAWNEDGTQLLYSQAVDRNVGELLFVDDNNKIIGVGKKLGITPPDKPSSTPATMSVMCTVFAEQDAVDDVRVDDVSVVTDKVANISIVDKANKVQPKPDIAWGVDPLTVPAGRVLNLNVGTIPYYNDATQVSYVAYATDQPEYYFGIWTSGGGDTHIGEFRLNNGVPEVVQDVFTDVNGWRTNQYLMLQSIINQDVVTVGDTPDGFDLLNDITVRSEGKKDLVDVENEITQGLSELSLKKLSRDEADRIYDTRTDVDAKIAAAELADQTWLPAVQTKAELPTTVPSATTNYLIRVIKDPTTSNNGVYQWIAGATEWTYFSDNLDFVDQTEMEDYVATAISGKQDKSPNDNKIYALNNAGLFELPDDIGDRTAIVTDESGEVTVDGDVLTINPDFYAAIDIFDLNWEGVQLDWHKSDDGALFNGWYEDGHLKPAKYLFSSTDGTVTRSLYSDVDISNLYINQLHAPTSSGVISVYNSLDLQGKNISNVGLLTVDGISADTATSISIADPINLNGNRIVGLGTPNADTDAANKSYVDTQITAAKITKLGTTLTNPTQAQIDEYANCAIVNENGAIGTLNIVYTEPQTGIGFPTLVSGNIFVTSGGADPVNIGTILGVGSNITLLRLDNVEFTVGAADAEIYLAADNTYIRCASAIAHFVGNPLIMVHTVFFEFSGTANQIDIAAPLQVGYGSTLSINGAVTGASTITAVQGGNIFFSSSADLTNYTGSVITSGGIVTDNRALNKKDTFVRTAGQPAVTLTTTGENFQKTIDSLGKNLQGTVTIEVTSQITGSANIDGFYSTIGAQHLRINLNGNGSAVIMNIRNNSNPILLGYSSQPLGTIYALEVNNCEAVYLCASVTFTNTVTISRSEYFAIGQLGAGQTSMNVNLAGVICSYGATIALGSRIGTITTTGISGSGKLRINQDFSGTLPNGFWNKITQGIEIVDLRNFWNTSISTTIASTTADTIAKAPGNVQRSPICVTSTASYQGSPAVVLGYINSLTTNDYVKFYHGEGVTSGQGNKIVFKVKLREWSTGAEAGSNEFLLAVSLQQNTTLTGFVLTPIIINSIVRESTLIENHEFIISGTAASFDVWFHPKINSLSTSVIIEMYSCDEVSGNDTLLLEKSTTVPTAAIPLTISGATDSSYSPNNTLTTGVWAMDNTGHRLYKKVVEFGALPNATTAFVNLDIPNATFQICKIEGTAWNETSGEIIPLPLAMPVLNECVGLWAVKNGTSYGANIRTGLNRTAFNKSFITVWYYRK